MAVSTLLPALAWRMGLPLPLLLLLLGTAHLVPARFRWPGFTLITLDRIPLVVPVHLPLIPLLLLRRGPFHLPVGLCLLLHSLTGRSRPIHPLARCRLLRSRTFHPLLGGCLPRTIALRTPLNLCRCLPPCL